MKTYIYMVRHCESAKTEGNERTRGLTDQGKIDAYHLTEVLQKEGIEVYVSSPYNRAILSIQDLAKRLGKDILIFEDLKERVFFNEDSRLLDKELSPLLKKSFSDPNFALSGGESNMDCQTRAVKVLKQLLKNYQGRKVVLATHGCVMTLMMG
jgi:2,3-bisphosphoglycerate-dependent phosphoglycerate mutase